jgi:HEAT repeat protein
MTVATKNQVTGREPRLSKKHRERGVRRLSLRRLGTTLDLLPPHAISVDAALAMLDSEDYLVRYTAAKMIAQRGDRDARLMVESVLNNGEVPARASVARHLYGFSWFSAESLVRQALDDLDARVREGAIYALCDMRDLNAYQLMAESLQAEEDSVLEAAAWGLRNAQDSAAIPALKAVLSAQDPDIRVKALETLGASGVPEAAPVARDAIDDPNPDVAYAATLSLLELAGERALTDLADLIERTSGLTRQHILRGFFHATNYLQVDVAHSEAADRIIDALEAATHDDFPGARMEVAWPLAWIRHQRTPALLKNAYFAEQDSEVKAHMLRVAADLMSGASDEILQDALESRDASLRTIAREIDDKRAAGEYREYDRSAQSGSGLQKPLQGR